MTDPEVLGKTRTDGCVPASTGDDLIKMNVS